MDYKRQSLAYGMNGLVPARRWIRNYFVIVPGDDRYNFRRRPGVDPKWQFECLHGRFNLVSALQHLIEHHGGIEVVLTEEMRQEVEKCRLSKLHVPPAAELILERYQVTERLHNELRFADLDGQHLNQVKWDHLDQMLGLPEVEILAKIHGPKLGQSLLDRIRGGRQMTAWESGFLGQPWRQKRGF